MATPEAYARGDETPTVDGTGIQYYPEFELTFLFNERPLPGRPPREVTILPNADMETNYTQWITVDGESAVDLREVL